MSFVSVLKTIGTDVEKGISIAEPIIAKFVPMAAPILTEISAVIAALESLGSSVTQEQLSQIIQAIATASAIKQAAAAVSAPAPAT